MSSRRSWQRPSGSEVMGLPDAVSMAIVAVTVIVQLIAAWYAWRVLRLLGPAWFWALVVIAMLVQALRRVNTLFIDASLLPPDSSSLLAWLDSHFLAFVISACMLLGMRELYGRLKKKFG